MQRVWGTGTRRQVRMYALLCHKMLNPVFQNLLWKAMTLGGFTHPQLDLNSNLNSTTTPPQFEPRLTQVVVRVEAASVNALGSYLDSAPTLSKINYINLN